MNDVTRSTTRLKQLFNRPGKAMALSGPSNVVVARMMESLGYEALYIGAANSIGRMMGRPDDGSITMTESVMFAKWFAEGVSIPIWVDADACFGGPVQVERAVREYIKVGAAGVTIEDQPFFSKRFGGAAGKEIIPIEDAVEKYRVAVATKNELDPDFQLVARCDALEARDGGGVAGAIERLLAYKEVGADVLYIEAPRTFEELAEVRAAVPGPLMCTTYRLPRSISVKEAGELGLSTAHSTRPRRLLAKAELALYALFLAEGATGIDALEPDFIALLERFVDVNLRDDDVKDLFRWTGSGEPGSGYQASIARDTVTA